MIGPRVLCCAVLGMVLASASAQIKPLPTGFHIGLCGFLESDGAFSGDRSKPAIDYALDRGWGVLLGHAVRSIERVGLMAGTGLWWFRNPTKGTLPNGQSYDQRAIALPQLLGVSCAVVRGRNFGLYVHANGGAAHVQYIQELDEGGLRVDPCLEPLYGGGIALWVGLYNMRGTSFRAGPWSGGSVMQLGGRTLRTVYGMTP
jgi:hypothetical protein